MIKPSQALQFAGKSVLVTGGGSGIGAAVAQSFSAAGAWVALHYSRNREGAQSVASVMRPPGGQAITLAGDLLARRAVPRGRLGSADESVGAYLFLADDVLSGYITGQIIEVNGGQLMP